MGKKYIVVQTQKKNYRVFSEDIKMVFMKGIRKVPRVPQFYPLCKNFEDDTEEEEVSQQTSKQ